MLFVLTPCSTSEWSQIAADKDEPNALIWRETNYLLEARAGQINRISADRSIGHGCWLRITLVRFYAKVN